MTGCFISCDFDDCWTASYENCNEMNAPSTIFCLRVKLNLLWFALFENLFIRHDSRYDLFRENAASVVPTADWYTVRCIITRATCLTIDTSSLTHEDDVFWHDSDVMMGTMASQITSLTIVYSTFIKAQIKENIKVPRHWPLWGEFPDDRWIPRTKGQ